MVSFVTVWGMTMGVDEEGHSDEGHDNEGHGDDVEVRVMR
jgi:hypothetical protein